MQKMHEYTYIGPVKLFKQTVHPHWIGQTMAVSAAKARSNLAYQYKKEHKLTANAQISLPGEIIQED